MAIYGQLTIINLTGDDLLIKAYEDGRGPKRFTVQAGATVRKTGIRISRSDRPSNYRRTIRMTDIKRNVQIYDSEHRYKAVLGYELILSCDKIEGRLRVTELTELPSLKVNVKEQEYLKMLAEVADGGLDHFGESGEEVETMEFSHMDEGEEQDLERIFIGKSQNGDINEAILQAVKEAKETIKTDFVAWKLLNIHGQNGGFIHENIVMATIIVKEMEQPNE